MSALRIVCNISIISTSIGLFLGSAGCARLLAMFLIFEMLFPFDIGAMWNPPKAGRGIATATGTANAGLMTQFILLMPKWIPIVLGFLGPCRQHPVPASDTTLASPSSPDSGERSDATERRTRAFRSG